MNKLEKLKNTVMGNKYVKDYEIYEVLYDYSAIKEGDLNIKAGTELCVVKGQMEEGWLEAVCINTGNRGFVPSNFIRKMPKSGRAKPALLPPKAGIPTTLAPPIPTNTPPLHTQTPTFTQTHSNTQIRSTPYQQSTVWQSNNKIRHNTPTHTHNTFTHTHNTPTHTHNTPTHTHNTFTHTHNKNSTLDKYKHKHNMHSNKDNNESDIIKVKHYIAQYDFTPSLGIAGSVKMNEGDRVVVRVDHMGAEGGDDDWVWASVDPHEFGRESLEGYVPMKYLKEDITMQPWYFPDRTREEAETLLQTLPNTHGSFLIRQGQSSQGLSLSVRVESEVKHYRIKTEGSSSDTATEYYISPNRRFHSLSDLVEHYKENPGLVICLSTPCKDDEAEVNGRGLPEWEIARRSLLMKKRIGGGYYGIVYEGVWDDKTPVAIKAMKPENINIKEFSSEAGILKSLRHPCLVKLFGVCSKPIDQPLYIVTELVTNGSLLEFLQHRAKVLQSLSPVMQARIGTQVASGMSYLEEHAYVHRDLAARNVLVGDDLKIKIADFGLARLVKEGIYEVNTDVAIATRWTAPEALQKSRYTSKSDVWSYGILLYEIVTHGDKPYPELKNNEVRTKVVAGYRMPRPQTCAIELYEVMTQCWRAAHESRPKFAELKPEMERLVTQFS